jgi:PKD repeat protein
MADASPSAVRLGALSPLPANGTFTPTNDPYRQGTVQFHVVARGATEYCWSFGDGATFPTGCTTGTAWSTDPVVGPNPVHSYTALGTYRVTVQVRNCVNTTARTSAPLTINVH